MSEKLVLLTGATGFIGRHITSELISAGYRLRILTRRSTFHPQNEGHIEVKVVDYLKEETLKGIGDGVDYVIHMAGVIKGKSFDVFKKGNIYTTLHLLNEIKNYPIKKFIYLSSQSAAGPSGRKPLREDAKPHPVSFYGLSKKIAEEKVVSSKLPYVILRPSAVFGEGDRETLSLFQMAKWGLSISIGGGPFFNLIYVKDLAKVILNTLEKDVVNTVYFVNNGEVYSPQKLSALLRRVMGKEYALHVKVPKRIAGIVAFLNEYYAGLVGKESMLTREKFRELKQYAWLASNEKLKREVYNDFTPTEEALRRTYEWYKEYGWL